MEQEEGSGRGQEDDPSYLFVSAVGRNVKFDIGRLERKGFPEVVFAVGKSDEEILSIMESVVLDKQPVVISRLTEARIRHIVKSYKGRGRFERGKSTLLLAPPGWRKPGRTGMGRVAVVTAGSSDSAAADEAISILGFLGYSHGEFLDCGIAGIQRTFRAAEEVISGKYSVCIVFAGMEGALASVFASLVPIPVIGVPTSNGYGFGGGGVAALQSMLQSCVPGLLTVNIDNGVGAAAAAVSILRSSDRQ